MASFEALWWPSASPSFNSLRIRESLSQQKPFGGRITGRSLLAIRILAAITVILDVRFEGVLRRKEPVGNGIRRSHVKILRSGERTASKDGNIAEGRVRSTGPSQ